MGGASRAVMSKIMSHEGAAAAMATTMEKIKAQQAARRRDVPPRRRGAGERRLRWANATAAAWPTLSESTPAAIGMRTRRVGAPPSRPLTGRVPRRRAARRRAAGRPASTGRSASPAGVSAHVSKPAAWSTARSSGHAVGPGDRQEQHLAHAHPHRAPVVRVDALRVEHEPADAERPRRAGDGAEVLRVVEPLEDAEQAAAPATTSASDGQRPAVGGGDRAAVEVEPDGGREHGLRGDVHRRVEVVERAVEAGQRLRRDEHRAHAVARRQQARDRP